MHPWRDQGGKIKIIRRARDMAKVIDEHTQEDEDGNPTEVHDYYNTTTKEFIFRSHKTRATHGIITQKVSDLIHTHIMTSLAHPQNNREWLITKPGDKTRPYGKGITKILQQPHVLGMGVNLARHSYISWWLKQSPRKPQEQDDMAQAMMTSKEEMSGYKWFKTSEPDTDSEAEDSDEESESESDSDSDDEPPPKKKKAPAKKPAPAKKAPAKAGQKKKK